MAPSFNVSSTSRESTTEKLSIPKPGLFHKVRETSEAWYTPRLARLAAWLGRWSTEVADLRLAEIKAHYIKALARHFSVKIFLFCVQFAVCCSGILKPRLLKQKSPLGQLFFQKNFVEVHQLLQYLNIGQTAYNCLSWPCVSGFSYCKQKIAALWCSMSALDTAMQTSFHLATLLLRPWNNASAYACYCPCIIYEWRSERLL